MRELFKANSYQLANKKWVPNYTTEITDGISDTTSQDTSFNKQFDSKESADEFITNYFIKQDYVPVAKNSMLWKRD
jgi:hypothetical protein